MKKNQNRMPLVEALELYDQRDVIPFDVPGHKHGIGNQFLVNYLGEKTLRLDVNSMKPLDNISNPVHVIQEAELLLADAYGADYGYFLVNGTTFGVQAMIMAATMPHEKLILPRNVHKSAINALILNGAIPVYMQPSVNSAYGITHNVTFEEAKKTIDQNSDAKAIFLTNPTYYGFTCELKKITEYAKGKGLLVLVDEAHGAHFPFHREMPISAMEAGADMSCVSLHKTGGSLTQSSALLLRERVLSKDRVKTILNLTQTTSASYLLMLSLDAARKQLATSGQKMMQSILEYIAEFREKMKEIPQYTLFSEKMIGQEGIFDFDPFKVGIHLSNIKISGLELYDLLRDRYGIQLEFGDLYNVLAISSLGDTRKNFDRLYQGLKEVAEEYQGESKCKVELDLKNPEVILSPRDAFYSRKRRILLKDAEGEIAGESIMAYPPGIPIVSPGERVTKEMIEHIQMLKVQKSMLTGAEDPNFEFFKVLGF